MNTPTPLVLFIRDPGREALSDDKQVLPFDQYPSLQEGLITQINQSTCTIYDTDTYQFIENIPFCEIYLKMGSEIVDKCLERIYETYQIQKNSWKNTNMSDNIYLNYTLAANEVLQKEKIWKEEI